MVKLNQERSSYRRNRRNRKTWYREPRFDNRKKEKGWFAPSIRNKLDTHIKVLNQVSGILPVSETIIEVASFDTQKMQNPEIYGIEYQQGELQGYLVKEYLLEKFERKCVYCRKTNVPLEIEHIIPKSRHGSNRVSNLAISCHKCNQRKGDMTAKEFGHPNVMKNARKNLTQTAFMNAVRWKLTKLTQSHHTFGYITKHDRIRLGLPKSHTNDAFVIAGGTTGHATPDKFGRIIGEAVKRFPDVEIEVHCHNDAGLSVANAIAGIEAGAHRVDTTVYGLEERNGISDQLTIAEYLKDYTGKQQVDGNKLLSVYDYVLELIHEKMGMDFFQHNCPHTGRNVQTHTAGTHAAFSDVFQGGDFSVNVYAGRSMIRKILSANNMDVGEDELRKIVLSIKNEAVETGRALHVDDILRIGVKCMARVIELGHIIAGPCAGLILSDLGHEVIKIEKPGSGDISRRLTKQSAGAFPFYNRNKKSVCIDINSREGAEAFRRLIGTADVIIDNLGPGAVERAGFPFEKISAINPRIIYLSLKGYGKGPYEKRKSLDYPIEVHSGLAYMTGLKGKPMRVDASIVDMSAAMFGVIGVLNALIEREATGRGKYLDVGMFETSAVFMGQHVATAQLKNVSMEPLNEMGFAWGIYDFFRTEDDVEVFIAVTTDPQCKAFCRGFSMEVCGNGDYETNAARFDSRDTLIPSIREKISVMDSSDVTGILEELNISYALLNAPRDLLNDPQMKDKMVTETYNGRTIRVPQTPLGSIQRSDPPELGEHTEEVINSLEKESGHS